MCQWTIAVVEYTRVEASTEAIFEEVETFGEVKVIQGLCPKFLGKEEVK